MIFSLTLFRRSVDESDAAFHEFDADSNQNDVGAYSLIREEIDAKTDDGTQHEDDVEHIAQTVVFAFRGQTVGAAVWNVRVLFVAHSLQ